MSSIDERVVKMEFDNKQFESGVSETMSSLQKLKMALKMRGSDEGLSDVQKAANSLSFGAVNDQIYQVQQNFSFMGRFVINIFDRIANKVIDLGSTMVRELTTAPLKAGFSEYELQMDSTQTIMASTGKSIAEVTGYLDELNTYADKTIYSFSDMTANIGKFTNAGVELEDAVAAIQGISNEAAVSGANANEASRAMYNFSQALSAGAVKLVDWKSIENANMATKEFKEQLIDTAVALGTVKKTEDGYVSTTKDLQGKVSDTFTATKGFNDSLSAQWMTTEVLTETLKHYATDVRDMSKAEKKAYEERLKNLGFDDKQIKTIEELGKKAFDSAQDVKTFSQLVDTVKESLGSGWTKSFQYMIGNLEEAKVLWTGVNKEITAILDPIANAREEMLKFWHDHGGRKAAIEAVSNAWQGVKSIMGAVSEAFKTVFPPMTGKRLVEITKGVRDLTERFKNFATSSSTLFDVKHIFEGLFSAIKLVINVCKVLFDKLSPLLDIFGPFVERVSMAAVTIGMLVKQAAEADNPLEVLKTKFHYITNACLLVIGGIENLVKALLDLVGIHIEGNPITHLFDSLARFASEHFDFSLFDGLSALGSVATNALSGLADILSTIINFGTKSVGGLFDGLLNGFGKLTDGSKKAAEGIQPLSEKILPTATTVFDKFAGFVATIGDKIAGFAKSIGEKLPSMFEYLGSSEFRGLIDNFNAAIGGGLLISLRNLVETMNKSKKAGGEKKGIFGAIAGVFEGVNEKISDVLDGLTDALSGLQENIKVGSILKIAAAVGILAVSIGLLASIDADKTATGIAAIASCFGLLVGSVKALESGAGAIVSQSLSALATALIKMSIAVGILSLSVTSLSKLNMRELAVGLGGVVGILAALVVTVSALSRFGGDISTSAKGLITLSIALGILTLSVKSLSKLNMDQLQAGLVGVGVLLGEIALFGKLFSANAFSVQAAVSIVGIAVALKLLSSTVGVFSSMGDGVMVRGLEGVGILLASIALFSRTFDGGGLSIGAAASILTTVAALKVLEGVAITFAGLDEGKMTQGLGGVAILLLSISLFSKTLSSGGLPLKAAASVVILAMAISQLSTVVTSLGGMSWEQFAVGITGLATSVLVMVGALVALSYGSASMLTGAVAMTVLVGALRLFVPVIHTLASMDIGTVGKGLISFGLAIAALVASAAVLSAVAPIMLTASAAIAAFGAAVLVFGAGILVAATGITAFSVAFTALGAAVVTNAGIISVGIISLFTSVFVGIVTGITQAAAALANGIGEILGALSTIIHAVGDFIIQNIPYILNVVGTLIASVLSLGIKFVPQIVMLIGIFVASIITTIVTFIPTIAAALVAGAISLLNSLANGIRDNAEPIFAAVRNILSSILELILTAVAELLSMIPGVGGMLAGQVENARDAVQQTLAPETIEGYTNDAMSGAVSGIEKGGDQMADAAAEASQSAKDSISENLTDGGDISGDFMSELVSGFAAANGELASVGDANLQSYISEFSKTDEVNSAGIEINEELIAGLGSDTDAFKSIGDSDINAFLAGFNPDIASKTGKEAASSAANGAGSVSSKFSSAGRKDAQRFTHGLTTVNANSSGKTLGLSGATGAGSTKGSYQTVGSNVASGFSWGVASPTAMSIARAAGVRLGHKAIEGIKDGVKSRSPSREAMKVGRQTTEGFVIGIDALSQVVYDESAAVGRRSIDGIRDSISKMSKYVSMDMDMDPTIRPVLDLSEVQNGITRMDGMFSRADDSLLVGFGNGGYANSVIGSLLNAGGLNSAVAPDMSNASNKTVNISLNLQYDASADANELARGIAYAVQPYVVRGV